MKSISKLLLICSLLSSYSLNAEDLWTRKADFGGAARIHAVGFSIGDKGYIGTGYFYPPPTQVTDFWEYDPQTDTWTQKADFVKRTFLSVGFSIGDRGYIGTGWDGNINLSKFFWEYSPQPNYWTQKADFRGTARNSAVGFSIGDKGYMGTGFDGTSQISDFWEYDPQTNTWTPKAAFHGRGRSFAVGFSIGDKGYIGTGWSGTSELRDFWEYDPETDTWTQKADFGGEARGSAVGFSINDKGYIGMGFVGAVYRKDFWEYDPNDVVSVSDYTGIPFGYELFQNYPNPFNPSTTIRYALPERSIVKLEVYNNLGQHVATLVDTEKEAGYYEIEWHSGRVASGVYLYRVEAVSEDNLSNRYIKVKSMTLLK